MEGTVPNMGKLGKLLALRLPSTGIITNNAPKPPRQHATPTQTLSASLHRFASQPRLFAKMPRNSFKRYAVAVLLLAGAGLTSNKGADACEFQTSGRTLPYPLLLTLYYLKDMPGWVAQWGTASDDIAVAHDYIPTTKNTQGVDFVIVGHSPAARAYVGGSDCQAFTVNSNQASCSAVDLFVQRIGAKAGENIWRVSYGSSGDDAAASIASDADGNFLYVLGQSTSAGASRRQTAVPQSYMLKLNAGTGKLVSSRNIGDAKKASTVASFVKVDPISGDVYVVGTSSASTTPNGEACSKAKGGSDVFVCRLVASDLSYKWCRFVGTAGDESVLTASSSLAFDMHGNTYIGGTTNGKFSAPTTAGGATTDAFAAKLDGNGNVLWTKQMGDPNAIDQGVAVTYCPWKEKMYITGWTVGTFGDKGNKNRGDKDIFLAQLDAKDGAAGWTKMYGGTGEEYPTDLATFRERVFFIATENGPNWDTYWTDSEGKTPFNPDGTIRTYYNSAPLGGGDWLACEVVHTNDDGEYDWLVLMVVSGSQPFFVLLTRPPFRNRTGVPKGMPRWCSRFGSNADDVSATIRVDHNYNISLPGVINNGQMKNTLTGENMTNYGGKDVGFELYYECWWSRRGVWGSLQELTFPFFQTTCPLGTTPEQWTPLQKTPLRSNAMPVPQLPLVRLLLQLLLDHACR